MDLRSGIGVAKYVGEGADFEFSLYFLRCLILGIKERWQEVFFMPQYPSVLLALFSSMEKMTAPQANVKRMQLFFTWFATFY